jgi:TPR repeat protein
MYRTGMTIGRDYARASSLFEQACNLRSLHGCWAGEVFHHPTHGDLKDATRWAAHKERLCDPHGNAESCVELGLVYDLGTWLPKNADRANDLFRKSCLYGLRTGVKEGCALIRK